MYGNITFYGGIPKYYLDAFYSRYYVTYYNQFILSNSNNLANIKRERILG